MIRPASLRQRLILAAAAALVLDFALVFVGERFMPGSWQTLTLHGALYLQPVSCVALAISMSAGGWIGGRRFLPVGLLLVVLLQLLSVVLLIALARPTMQHRPLTATATSILASNAPGFALQLLCAALGVLAGASVHRPATASPSLKESP